ncbi:hypothetical protein CKF54_05370 [Psittacicella hinzii]|uniref:AI-2E family transporter n=1 Tax=Psittacicella hinzii TaxID=2028575 RepID=A0A3A1Y404_9GAMM|nr:AI-2E family transporter [Psittacicella hinzii]RIY32140.1 hypothetical protein CKF54_05370 [Psittacicella hinzii]
MSSWKDLFTRNFNNPQIVALILILLVISLVLYFFGKILAPVFLAIGLAYILNFPTRWLVKKGLKRIYALILIFGLVVLTLCWLAFSIVPLLIRQLSTLLVEAPSIVGILKEKLLSLEQYHIPYLDKTTLYSIYENINQYIQSNMDIRIDNILAVLQNVAYVAVNTFLVPFMAFLMLVDYGSLKKSVVRFLPQSSELADGVFKEFMHQLDNYVRGKVLEFIIMTILSFIAFAFFGLKYNLILSTIIGISVIIPYLGVIIATVPFVLVAFFQFQFTSSFWWLMAIHTGLQIFNGNILVPYLYSKTNNIRPITVIVAVIFFGQIWGILGVFLAIPLCTLIKAVANAWFLNSQIYFEMQKRQEAELKRQQEESRQEAKEVKVRDESSRPKRRKKPEEPRPRKTQAQQNNGLYTVKPKNSNNSNNKTNNKNGDSANHTSGEQTPREQNQPESNIQ